MKKRERYIQLRLLAAVIVALITAVGTDRSWAGYYNAGNGKIEVEATYPAEICIMDAGMWDNYVRAVLLGTGNWYSTLNVPAGDIRLLTHAMIGTGRIYTDTRTGLSNESITYKMGKTGRQTPSSFENLASGNYYVWVIGTDVVSQKYVNLGYGQTSKIEFDLRPRVLNVSSEPQGAKIIVNGKHQNAVTPANIRLPYERADHTVEVEKEGYVGTDGRRRPSQTALVLQGEEKSLHFAMKEVKYGYVTVNSSPAGSSINVNGAHMGATPARIKVYPNESTRISLSKQNYETAAQSVSVGENEERQISLSLNPYLDTTFFHIGGVTGYFDNDIFKDSYGKFYGAEIGFQSGSPFAVYVTGLYAAAKADKGKLDAKKEVESAELKYFDFSFGAGFAPKFWRVRLLAGAGLNYNYLEEKAVILGESYSNSFYCFTFEARAMLQFYFTPSVSAYMGLRRSFNYYTYEKTVTENISGYEIENTETAKANMPVTFISLGITF